MINLHVFNDGNGVSKAAAEFIVSQVDTKPDSVLLLPTGQTVLDMYNHLVTLVRAGRLDLSRVHIFNLDEFYGLPSKNPGSYKSYMQHVLLDHVPIRTTNIHLLDGDALAPKTECARYEAAIKAVGGVDLAVLGLGGNGHIAFNEPGSDFTSCTRLVPLREETRAANAFLFNNLITDVPVEALTVGIATILEARCILLLAIGRPKVEAIRKMLRGPVTPDVPASALQTHPDVTVLVDREAAPQDEQ